MSSENPNPFFDKKKIKNNNNNNNQTKHYLECDLLCCLYKGFFTRLIAHFHSIITGKLRFAIDILD